MSRDRLRANTRLYSCGRASERRVRVSEAEQVEAPRNQASVGVDAGAARAKPSRARRMLHILAAVLVAVVLPAVLMWALVAVRLPPFPITRQMRSVVKAYPRGAPRPAVHCKK